MIYISLKMENFLQNSNNNKIHSQISLFKSIKVKKRTKLKHFHIKI